VQDNTKSPPPLDVGPSFARTRINLRVILASPSRRGNTHTNSLVGVTRQGKNTDNEVPRIAGAYVGPLEVSCKHLDQLSLVVDLVGGEFLEPPASGVREEEW